LVRRQNEGRRIDTFVMSCRIISYGIESALLWAIVQDARRDGAAVLGEFIESAKNAPAQDFYARHGFTRAGNRGPAELWVLDPNSPGVASPAWIIVEEAP
jgi:predicted enzyme involved in methoxymalonyl-ACP biosynthesis